MLSRRAGSFLLIASAILCPARGEAQTRRTEHAILITLDGVRTEEIFGGLDMEVLRGLVEKGRVEDHPLYARYWAKTPEERRLKVMPFFWGTLMTAHGSIAGNTRRGSSVSLTNRHRFSYPGYAEILTGEAHDSVIDSNDNRRYAFPTVLEFVKDSLKLAQEDVAVFASWETFNWIAEHKEGALTINAGYEPFETADPAVQSEVRTPWDSARHDAVTFRLAMSHLAASRPRMLYLALDETDDWAHDGRYDRVLQTLGLVDSYLETLWRWLQADLAYRDTTAIVITVDHGRGRTRQDWTKHGEKIEGAQDTWIACIGPDWPRRGEWTSAPPAHTNQIAATLAQALGLDFTAGRPGVGRPLQILWQR
jgi:hypothetical protein